MKSEVRITTTFFDSDVCAVCGREWEQGQTAVATAYSVESIDAGRPPEPVFDFCIQKHDPKTFAELLEERQRFHRS